MKVQANSVTTSWKGLNNLCRYKTSAVTTEQSSVMVNSKELIGSTEYLTLYTRRRLNRCRSNRVRIYVLEVAGQTKLASRPLRDINPLNPELNPICYLLALLGAHHFIHVSRIRVKFINL